ncbi:hypothetical protein [Streptomyces smyrnaeus]
MDWRIAPDPEGEADAFSMQCCACHEISGGG